MRLSPEISDFLSRELLKIPVQCQLFLFGSRTSETAKGGDIDILILSESKLERKFIRDIRIGFYKRFGFVKLDIVNFTFHEDNAFKDIIMDDAILIASNIEVSMAPHGSANI
jgi:predicted nucleotidyltransferase